MEATAPVSTGGGILKGIWWIFFGIFTLILLIYVVYACVQKRSVEPAITILGNEFLLTSTQLSQSSHQIVANQGLFHSTGNIFIDIITFFSLTGSLFLAIYIFYGWIYILVWLIGRSPLSTPNNVFGNIIFALVIFVMLQSLFSIGVHAVNKDVNCFSGCDGSAMSYISVPITAWVDLYHAIGVIIVPAYDRVNSIPIVFNKTVNNSLNKT